MKTKNWSIGIIFLLFTVFLTILSACNSGGNESTNQETNSNNETNNVVSNKDTQIENVEDSNEVEDVSEEKVNEEKKESDTDQNEKNDEKNNEATDKKSKTDTDQVEKSNEKTTSASSSKDTVTTKTETATETVKFKTVKQNDNSLEKGKTKVVQKGQNGTRTVTYNVTYKNGKEVSREKVSSKVTKKPVDQIVKVGTKEPAKKAKFISASEAHNILKNSGMRKAGNEYYLELGSSSSDLVVRVGSNHVTSIAFNPDKYIPWKVATKKELQEALGKKEAEVEYNYGKQQAKKIEQAVRAAANAVYGSGTNEANRLYQTMINKALKENKWSSCTFGKNGEFCEFG